jgi:hypothetical protein
MKTDIPLKGLHYRPTSKRWWNIGPRGSFKILSELGGFHGSEDLDGGALGYDTALSGKWLSLLNGNSWFRF